jgi:phosphatidylglycerophosphate synthase
MQSPPKTPAGDAKPGYWATVQFLASKQKTAKGAPAYSRFVNRRLGRLLAAGAYQLGLTPNAVTMISGAFSFAGIIVIALGKPSLAVALIASAALILGYALDSADGQLARLRGGGSLSGEWLDHMVDAAKLSCLHLAVLICFYRSFHFSSAGWLLIPAGYMVVIAVWFFGIMLVGELRKRKVSVAGPKGEEPKASLLRSILVLPQDYGFLCVAFLLFFSRDAFLVVYTFLFVGNALLLGGSLLLWYREFTSYDRAARLTAATTEGKS